MTPDSERVARHWDAAQTIHRLFQHLDDGRFVEVAALFLPDGRWARQDADLVGPAAVLTAMQQRPADLATRHMVADLVIDDDGEGEGDGVVARYYVTTYSHQGERHGPAPLGVPQFIFVCEDRLVRTDAGWRFARRSPRPVFKRADH